MKLIAFWTGGVHQMQSYIIVSLLSLDEENRLLCYVKDAVCGFGSNGINFSWAIPDAQSSIYCTLKEFYFAYHHCIWEYVAAFSLPFRFNSRFVSKSANPTCYVGIGISIAVLSEHKTSGLINASLRWSIQRHYSLLVTWSFDCI